MESANTWIEQPSITRARFQDLWSDLPRLTVLSALPGWGKSTWLAQCAGHVRAETPGAPVHLVSGRRAATSVLAATDLGDGALIVLDDAVVAENDPLWADIQALLARREDVKVVVASVDAPPSTAPGAVAPTVLDERDLAFTPQELDEVLAQISGTGASSAVDAFPPNLHGTPVLVGERARTLLRARRDGTWPTPDAAGPGALLMRYARWEPPSGAAPPLSLELLREARDLRTITAGALDAGASEPRARAVANLLDRLDALPFFEPAPDPESGARGFAWLPHIWAQLAAGESDPERTARMRRGLDRVRRAGGVTAQLYYLLESADLEQAELLVRRNFRRLLLWTDPYTTAELLRLEPAALADLPGLALLVGEMTRRRDGDTERAKRLAAGALRPLRRLPVRDREAELARTCLLAYAAASAGQRADVARALTHVEELTAAPAAPRQDRGGLSSDAVEHLYLAYWGAIQIDRHGLALRLARLMERYGDAGNLVTQIDAVGLRTQEDLLGLRSTAPDGAAPSPSEHTHAVSLLLLEDGEDDRAVDFLRPLQHTASRSAVDGLKLLVFALAAPDLLEGQAREIVRLSTSLWEDQHPSGLVALGGVLAHLAAGERRLARELAERVAPNRDPFSVLARTIWLQYAGEHAAAVQLALPLTKAAYPRTAVLAGTLVARSLADGGREEEGVAQLERTWRRFPAPRLLRFALRLIPHSVIERLLTGGYEITDGVREQLEWALARRSAIAWPGGVHLTRAERDIVHLMRQGLTNSQIADERFVTVGTLRSQIRGLYRKLGVSSRQEALAVTRAWPVGRS